MRRIYVLLLGLSPFFLGWLFQLLLITWSIPLPLFLAGLFVLLLWFFFGRLSRKLTRSSRQAFLLLNAIPLGVLILLVIQELILGRYWMNFVGGWSQLYFFPAANVGVTVLSPLYPILDALFGIRPIFSMVPYYILTFLLMLLASWLGCRTRNRR